MIAAKRRDSLATISHRMEVRELAVNVCSQNLTLLTIASVEHRPLVVQPAAAMRTVVTAMRRARTTNHLVVPVAFASRHDRTERITDGVTSPTPRPACVAERVAVDG